MRSRPKTTEEKRRTNAKRQRRFRQARLQELIALRKQLRKIGKSSVR